MKVTKRGTAKEKFHHFSEKVGWMFKEREDMSILLKHDRNKTALIGFLVSVNSEKHETVLYLTK